MKVIMNEPTIPAKVALQGNRITLAARVNTLMKKIYQIKIFNY